MIESVNLCNCQRLCGNLVRDLTKKQNILAKEQITLFFDHLLSSQKHGFQIVFPASFEAPSTLFRCHKDEKERDEACEFLIEIPPNFKCQNQGLALYAALENPQNKRLRYDSLRFKSCGVHLVMTQDGESESDDLEDANERFDGDNCTDLCEDEQDSEHDHFSYEDNEDGYFY
ncbi:unnamed protein product [Prunus armeniaca]